VSISVEPRINDRIRTPQVRVVGADGEQLGVMDTQAAMRMASAQDLDMVEVAPMARPPVVKLMDYSKFKYEQAIKVTTGGRAIGATSTMSRSCWLAIRSAAWVSITPSCSPSAPTTRTWGVRIRSLILGSTLMLTSLLWACAQTKMAAQGPLHLI
jgi:hypothetical protein